jgi:hypothetical protein
MGDQKAPSSSEPNTKSIVRQAVQQAQATKSVGQTKAGSRGAQWGNIVASAGSSRPDAGVLGGPGLTHPTSVRQRVVLARTLQQQQGNAYVQRVVLQGHSKPDVSDEAMRHVLTDPSPGRPMEPAGQRNLDLLSAAASTMFQCIQMLRPQIWPDS